MLIFIGASCATMDLLFFRSANGLLYKTTKSNPAFTALWIGDFDERRAP